MSVIAWDGKHLASDSRSVIGYVCEDSCEKVRAVKTSWAGPCLLGITGDMASGYALMDWFVGGAGVASYPERADRDGSAAHLVVVRNPSSPIVECYRGPYPTREHVYAWGTGSEVAIGVLHVNRNASFAVAVACKYISDCGGEAQKVSFEDIPE